MDSSDIRISSAPEEQGDDCECDRENTQAIQTSATCFWSTTSDIIQSSVQNMNFILNRPKQNNLKVMAQEKSITMLRSN